MSQTRSCVGGIHPDEARAHLRNSHRCPNLLSTSRGTHSDPGSSLSQHDRFSGEAAFLMSTHTAAPDD